MASQGFVISGFMIRVLIFVIFPFTAWCQRVEKLNTGDSLKFISYDQKYSTARTNQGLWHAPPNPSFYTPNLRSSRRNRANKPSVKEKTFHEQFSQSGVTTGMWCPRGHNRILGPHPTLGIVQGSWTGRWLMELEMELRFGQAEHNYKAIYLDSLLTTRHYLGYYMGLHVGYSFVNFKHTSIYLLAGIGYESMDVVPENNPQGGDGLSIDSCNLSGGLGLQHFGKKGGYWGVELMYNVINYCNPGGTPLDGNGITLRLTLGSIEIEGE